MRRPQRAPAQEPIEHSDIVQGQVHERATTTREKFDRRHGMIAEEYIGHGRLPNGSRHNMVGTRNVTVVGGGVLYNSERDGEHTERKV